MSTTTTTTGQTTVIVQPTRAAGSWFAWLAFLICLGLLLWQYAQKQNYYDEATGTTEKYVSGKKTATKKIAIISIEGVIATGEGHVRKQIDRIREDKDVAAVVIRVNSPGGTVTGSDYIYHHLKKLREERKLPMVVSMGSIAASGGYYVSMAVGHEPDAIYGEPTTTTGSIGVIIPHYDLSGLMKRFDLKDDSIATHPRKQMLSMTREMPEEHRQLLLAYINESLDRFKSIVRDGRKTYADDPTKLDALATGEIFSATKAKENGLIDQIGFLEDAIAAVEKKAGLEPGQGRVVKYEAPFSLSDFQLLKTESSTASELSAFTSPQPFYICTTTPVLMATWKALTEAK
jgi:protease IV